MSDAIEAKLRLWWPPRERDYHWCRPGDVFTAEMLQADAQHRARAGDHY